MLTSAEKSSPTPRELDRPEDAQADRVKDPRPTERMAIGSLTCSVVGLVFAPAAVAGIVLGYKARARIIRAEGSTKGEGLAKAGIITGFGGLALLVVLTVLTTLLAPHSNQSSDVALAERELIPEAEYPHGFVGQGSGSEVTEASYFAGLIGRDLTQTVECLGVSNSHIDSHPVEAAAQEYDRGNVWINNTVEVFPTKADAVKDATAAAHPRALLCSFEYWGPKIAQDLGPDLGPGERDQPPIALGVSTFGQHNSIEMFSVKYTYQNKAGIEYNDWVTVQVGRSESFFWISNLNSPISPKLLAAFVKDSEGRLTSP